MISKKTVLIGDFATGKTSLIRRFVDNEFSDDYLSTIGVKISRKSIVVDGIEVQNIIWDIEGATESKPIFKNYLLGLHGAIVVADVKRKSSIEHLKDHIETLYEISPDVPVVIALNKSDLLDRNEAKALLQEVKMVLGSAYYITLTSAKTGENVENLFQKLSIMMVR